MIGKTLEKKAESTRKTSESLKDEAYRIMFESDEQTKTDKIYKKILMSGDNGTGKTSLALFLMTYNLADDECVIYIDVDRSGAEIIQKFFNEKEINHQIRSFKPVATVERDGAIVTDGEGMVNLEHQQVLRYNKQLTMVLKSKVLLLMVYLSCLSLLKIKCV